MSKEFVRHPQGCFAAGDEARKRRIEGIPQSIQPVVFRPVGEKVSIGYYTGNPVGISEEDWTLPIRADGRRNGSYDVMVQHKNVGNFSNRESAIEEMNKYINSDGTFRDRKGLAENQ